MNLDATCDIQFVGGEGRRERSVCAEDVRRQRWLLKRALV